MNYSMKTNRNIYKKYAANAEYIHCAIHGLNLATSYVTLVGVVCNAQLTMKSVIYSVY